MSALPKTVATARARVAALSRDRDPSDPEFVDARRALTAASLESHIQRTVAAAPPLTGEQTERLVALLRGARARDLAEAG